MTQRQQKSAILLPSGTISDPAIADATLAVLGLDRVPLWSAGVSARDFASTLTKNNPLHSHAQINGAAVRSLRDGLAPRGFKAEIRNRLALTTHPAGLFTILVATGTPDTGDPSPSTSPTNAHPKSEAVYDLLQQRLQLSLPSLEKGESPILYVLLYRIDPLSRDIRLELSEPKAVVWRKGKKERHYYFRGWNRRIIIENPNSLPGKKQVSPAGGWTPNLTVPVQKKAATG